jgi:hypothetical protein
MPCERQASIRISNGAPGATASIATPVTPAPARAASQAERQASSVNRRHRTPIRDNASAVTPRPPDRRSPRPEASRAARKTRSVSRHGAAWRPTAPRPRCHNPQRRQRTSGRAAADLLLDQSLDPVDPFAHRTLQHGEFGVPQIGDQHAARRVRDTELRLHLSDHRLRRDAASPEHRQFIGATGTASP